MLYSFDDMLWSYSLGLLPSLCVGFIEKIVKDISDLLQNNKV